jgi:hypothetical protein
MTVLRAARSLLLSGISPEEALALRWSDVERACGVARVIGANARAVRLHADVANSLSAISAPPEAPVLSDTEGGPVSLDSLSEALAWRRREPARSSRRSISHSRPDEPCRTCSPRPTLVPKHHCEPVSAMTPFSSSPEKHHGKARGLVLGEAAWMEEQS